MLEDPLDRAVLPMLLEVETEEEAALVIEVLVQKFMRESGETREQATQTVRFNIGFLGGYTSNENRARIERLFKVEHPFFGSIEKNGPPSPEHAFNLGFALGEKLTRRDEGKKDD